MLKIFTHNFWIKLICVLIASGIWVYVANGQSKVDNFPGSIPVEVINKPEELVVIKDVDFIELRIVTERGLWKKLSADTFHAYIDLAGLEEGTHEVSVNVNSSIEGVQIVEVNPPKILVRLEPLVTKDVPVMVKAEGSAAEGHVPGEAIISPETVSISGAESVVDKITAAIALVRLNGESERIEGKIVTLVAYNEKNEVIKNLEFNPSQVRVNLPIIRATQTKTVGIKVNTSGIPTSGYWVSQITTEPATVVITGSTKSLNQTEYIETKDVSVENLKSDKITTAELNLPTNISLVGGQRSQISVRIIVVASSTQKNINARINYNNIPDNLRISNVDPETIEVLVSGPEDILANLSSQDVGINVDLTGYGSGTHNHNISYSVISVPNLVAVVNFMPSSLRITLENE